MYYTSNDYDGTKDMSKLTDIQRKMAQAVTLEMYHNRGTSDAVRLEQTIEHSEAVAELIAKAYYVGWNSAMTRLEDSINYRNTEL